MLIYCSMYILCPEETICSPPAYRWGVWPTSILPYTSTNQRYNKTHHLYGERQRSGTALTSFMHAMPLCVSSLPSSLATSAKDIPLSVFVRRSFITRECTASIVAAIVTRRLSSSRVSTKLDPSSREECCVSYTIYRHATANI